LKNLLLFGALYFSVCAVYAQQTVNRRNRLTSSVVEKYQSLIEANKEVRQGNYQAFYKKDVLIANGHYTNNQRTGKWTFYNNDGKAIELFDYDKNLLLDEAAEDSTSNFRYVFDGNINKTDRMTKPLKIGGRYYGYLPFLKAFKIPSDLSGITRRDYTVILEILVSPGGMLADFKIHLNSRYYQRLIPVDIDRMPDDARKFLPATQNGQPIASRIFISCYLDDGDDIDIE